MTTRTHQFKKPALGRILLADGQHLPGRSLEKNLKKNNVEVSWAQDFDEALESLHTNRFHAVIVDALLGPKPMDGFRLVKEAQHQGIPSVVFSSKDSARYSRIALNLGAEHFFWKPVSANELTTFLVNLWENPNNLIARRERSFDRMQLTAKEREICRLILKGLSNEEVAKISNTTLGTVKFYSHQIFQKFDVSGRGELFSVIFPT